MTMAGPKTERVRSVTNYQVLAQAVADLRDPENAPAVSMAAYLVQTGQESLLRVLSVYSERGETAAAARLLYMNAPAADLWRAMGKRVVLLGTRYRPPQTAALAFGVPYSD